MASPLIKARWVDGELEFYNTATKVTVLHIGTDGINFVYKVSASASVSPSGSPSVSPSLSPS